MEHTGRAKAAEFLAIVEGLFDQRAMEEYISGMPQGMKDEIKRVAHNNYTNLRESLLLNLLMQILSIKAIKVGASPDTLGWAVRMMAMIEFITTTALPDDK